MLREGTVDTRSDLYSFAAVVYQMATGSPPFGGKHDIQNILARLNDLQPPSLDILPAQLRALIGDLFNEHPDTRVPQSARAGRAILPTTDAMQAARAQLSAIVEPLYRQQCGRGQRGRIPQLCFDVPPVVEAGDVGALDDTDRDSQTDIATGPQAEAATDSGGASVDVALEMSGLHWAPEYAIDAPHRAIDAGDPSLSGRRLVPGTESTTSPRFSGSLLSQEARMDARRRFLLILGHVISDLPVLWMEGFNTEPDADLQTVAVDITLLYPQYEALADSDKEAIEDEWAALGIALSNTNLVHFSTRDLYDRIAVKFGFRDPEVFEDADTDPMHQVGGATRLAVVRNEVDADLPTYDADTTLDAVPVEVLDDVRQDERLEQKRGFQALLESLGVADSGDEGTSTDPADGDTLTAGDVALTGLLYRNMYEQFYGRPPASFDSTTSDQSQSRGSGGHLQLVVQQESVEAGDSGFVGPVLATVPERLGESTRTNRYGASSRGRIVAVGGALTAVAALALAVLLPQTTAPESIQTSSPAAVQTTPLPISERDYPTCEPVMANERSAPAVASPASEPVAVEQAPIATPPKRRKVSKVNIVKESGGVLIRREDEPDLMVRVQEVDEDGQAVKGAELPEPLHSVDMKAMSGIGLEFPITSRASLTMEVSGDGGLR